MLQSNLVHQALVGHLPASIAGCRSPPAAAATACSVQPRRCWAARKAIACAAAAALASTGDTCVSVSTGLDQFDNSTLRVLWDSVPKPLLRIGKGGVQASHVGSMQELLLAHPLLKVQINHPRPEIVVQYGQELAEESGAQLLQVKGRTLLFTSTQPQQLLALAQAPARRRAGKRGRPGSDGDAPSSPPVLAPAVQEQLAASRTRYDAAALRTLAAIPPDHALKLLRRAKGHQAIRNPSAWLVSQAKRGEANAAART